MRLGRYRWLPSPITNAYRGHYSIIPPVLCRKIRNKPPDKGEAESLIPVQIVGCP